jgi:hypothetical protein
MEFMWTVTAAYIGGWNGIAGVYEMFFATEGQRYTC